MHILCAGNSYTGRFIVQRFEEHQFSFLSRDQNQLLSDGLNVADLDRDTYDAILDCVPAVERNGQLEWFYWPDFERVLNRHQRLHGRSIPLVHISSTSVFGNTFGQAAQISELPVVNESSPLNPDDRRGLKRAQLEQLVRRLYPASLILRATGIYGPHRNVIQSLKNKSVGFYSNLSRVVNRIHVADLCQLALQMCTHFRTELDSERKISYQILHAVDEQPVTNKTLLRFIQEQWPLLFEGLELQLGAVNEEVSGKRVQSLYRAELLPGLQYRSIYDALIEFI